ncbi:MAG: protein kinase domain-containing protein [Terriglobales bacterium]
MALAPGSRLGPYEIVAMLGAGGMGEVYRARDARLQREAAIKVLPAALARDPERLRRFETEARAAGQLNHPNILAVYDFGIADSAPYLVTELLEGETLRARLTPPVALPAHKAIDIAGQVARGLAAAHAKGIVHRDLKPENIFLTRGGQAKILDFGLAKVVAPVSDDAVTVAAAGATSAGSVLGTAGYMAPEQVRGEAADTRSDLFALGAVLYEMLTARRAFEKPTAVETMSAILKEEPDAVALDPALQRVVDHCLEKDPAARFQSARDLEFALAALGGSSSTAARAAAPPRPSRARRRAVFSAAGILGLAIAAYLGFHFGRGAAPAGVPSLRFTIAPPPGASYGGSLALSPGGSELVFVANNNGEPQLWLRSLASLNARPLPGTGGATEPFWSPDGTQVGFFTDDALKRIDLASGAVQTITAVPSDQARGASWGADNTIVFSAHIRGPLMQISALGGTPVPATELDAARQEITHRWPQFLPDGRHFLFMDIEAGGMHSTFGIGSLNSDRFTLVAGEAPRSQAIYAGGYLLYARSGGLVAQRFDWRHARLSGAPQPLDAAITPVGIVGPTGFIPLSASRTGELVWRQTSAALSRLEIVDRTGKLVRAIGPPGAYSEPSLSPDGATIAARELDPATGNYAIWLIQRSTGAERRLTLGAADYMSPVWSRGGRWVYFSSNAGGPYNIYRKRTDGGGGEERVTRTGDTQAPADITAGGKDLLFTDLTSSDAKFAALLPLAGPGPVQRITRAAGHATGPRVSPDGRWMAEYADDASGLDQVFVTPFPNPGASRWQISTTGAYWPAWGLGGHTLYFVSNGMLVATRVGADASGAFTFQPPQPLFPLHSPEYVGDTTAPYTPLPNGDFLINVLTGDTAGAAAAPITIAIGWARALARP